MEKLIFPTGWEWDMRRDFTGVLCSYFQKTSLNSQIRQRNAFVKIKEHRLSRSAGILDLMLQTHQLCLQSCVARRRHHCPFDGHSSDGVHYSQDSAEQRCCQRPRHLFFMHTNQDLCGVCFFMLLISDLESGLSSSNLRAFGCLRQLALQLQGRLGK